MKLLPSNKATVNNALKIPKCACINHLNYQVMFAHIVLKKG